MLGGVPNCCYRGLFTVKRIVLFSAFAPTGGGGGTNLRTILPRLLESYKILWLYTSREPSRGFEEGWLGAPIVGSTGPVSDILTTTSLLRGSPSAALERIIEKIISVKCDAYWVVSHNEGLRVAWELTQRSSRLVHLTIQDDWAGALCARSVRYRFIAPLANNLSDRTICKVASIDVTSDGMRNYYKRRIGVDGVVIHPAIPEQLPAPVDQFACDKVTVGHAGSLYAIGEFLTFAKALAEYAQESQCSAEIKMWGTALADKHLPGEIRNIVTTLPACVEQELVPELARCHFLYAMYPFRSSLRIFTQTSLPTKLSTYVQAQRPILGHCPAESTLAAFLQDTETGVVWSNTQVRYGVQSIRCLMQQSIDRRQWERVRDLYYGKSNVNAMVQVFQKLTTRAF